MFLVRIDEGISSPHVLFTFKSASWYVASFIEPHCVGYSLVYLGIAGTHISPYQVPKASTECFVHTIRMKDSWVAVGMG